jgi:aldehyde dehydrogenase (NAD+)
VADAVAAARRAFDETSWPTDREFRARCLRQLQAAMESGFAGLQALTVAEAGAPVSWTEGPQLRTPIEGLGYMADVLESYQWEQDLGVAKPMGLPTRRRVHREAAGVVAAITPWNFP